MSQDVFLNIDAQPSDSISIISERLESRSQSGQFAKFRDNYFSLMNLNPNAKILELGAGTGVIGRAYIRQNPFNGIYVVSDLSNQLIKTGKEIALNEGLDKLMDFKVINAMSKNEIETNGFDAVIMHTLISHVPDPKTVLKNAVYGTKSKGIVVIFDADYASLQIISGDKELDESVNLAIKKGCVAQPTVMREVPHIAANLNLKLLNNRSDLLFEVGDSEFFISMGKALSSAIVKAGILNKTTADEWIKKLEDAISKNVFFGMCPFISYIYEVK